MPDTVLPHHLVSLTDAAPCPGTHAPATARIGDSPDLFRFAHKGIRHSAAQMLIQLGATPWEEPLRAAGSVADLQLLLEFIRRHMEEEQDVLHPALEMRLAGACHTVAGQHRQLQARLRDMGGLITAMARGGDEARPAIGHRLYLAFAGFVGELMANLAEEESVLLPLLRQLFTADQLRVLEQRMFEAAPIDCLLGNIRRLVPALSPEERAAMLSGMRDGVPTEVFLAVLERAAKPALAPAEWAALLDRLALTPG